jgi:hypothetical protein
MLLSLDLQLSERDGLNASKLSFLFSYPYLNPGYDGFFRTTRLFFSAIVLYALVIYVLSWRNPQHQDSSCVLLGLLGLVACNPLQYWFDALPGLVRTTGVLLRSLFVGFLRFFLFDRIQAVLAPKSSPWVQLFFAGFELVDLYFHSDQERPPGNVAALSGHVAFLVIYSFLVVFQWVRACWREVALPHEVSRTFCFGTVQLFSLLATLTHDLGSKYFQVIAFSPVPELVFLASHHVGAAACLFWSKEFHRERSRDHYQSRFSLDNSD